MSCVEPFARRLSLTAYPTFTATFSKTSSCLLRQFGFTCNFPASNRILSYFASSNTPVQISCPPMKTYKFSIPRLMRTLKSFTSKTYALSVRVRINSLISLRSFMSSLPWGSPSVFYLSSLESYLNFGKVADSKMFTFTSSCSRNSHS